MGIFNSEPALKENELEEILDEHKELTEKLPKEPEMEEEPKKELGLERKPAQKDSERLYFSDRVLLSQIKSCEKKNGEESKLYLEQLLKEKKLRGL